MLVILVVIGVLLVVAGTASFVGADSWIGQIDSINIEFNIDSGVFMGAGDGGVALGVIALALNTIVELIY